MHRLRDAGQHHLPAPGPAGCVTCVGSSDAPLTGTLPPAARLLIAEVSLCAKIAPNAATPSDPPICWKNIRALVATPMSLSATLFCAMSDTICMRQPMPRPRTA